jgi:hypothetical protein
MTRAGLDRRTNGTNKPGRVVGSRAEHRAREVQDSARLEPIGERAAERLLDSPETTLLDLVDRLLSKGVMASGDLTLGVAGVDLIYVRLSALLCAADRVMERPSRSSKRRQVRPPRHGTRIG